MISKIVRVALVGAIAMTVAGTAAPAFAGNGDVVRQGACSGSADWKLKLSPEDGRTEVEYEVDSNVNGQNWRVTLLQERQPVLPGHTADPRSERFVRAAGRDRRPRGVGRVPRPGGERRDGSDLQRDGDDLTT